MLGWTLFFFLLKVQMPDLVQYRFAENMCIGRVITGNLQPVWVNVICCLLLINFFQYSAGLLHLSAYTYSLLLIGILLVSIQKYVSSLSNLTKRGLVWGGISSRYFVSGKTPKTSFLFPGIHSTEAGHFVHISTIWIPIVFWC